MTLISGQSEAVLVDTLFTSDQAVSLGDWIQETLNGKNLTTIYITHGHGDHWFNLAYLARRFPGAQVVSTQESIAHMETQLTPEYRTIWNDLFPGQIGNESFQILAKPLKIISSPSKATPSRPWTLATQTPTPLRFCTCRP